MIPAGFPAWWSRFLIEYFDPTAFRATPKALPFLVTPLPNPAKSVYTSYQDLCELSAYYSASTQILTSVALLLRDF